MGFLDCCYAWFCSGGSYALHLKGTREGRKRRKGTSLIISYGKEDEGFYLAKKTLFVINTIVVFMLTRLARISIPPSVTIIFTTRNYMTPKFSKLDNTFLSYLVIHISFTLLFTIIFVQVTVGFNRRELLKEKFVLLLRTFMRPSLIILFVAGSIRNAGGYVWAYNTQPYFNKYYPSTNVGEYMSWIPLVGGSLGVVLGGFISDRLIKNRGFYARVWVLVFSQVGFTCCSIRLIVVSHYPVTL